MRDQTRRHGYLLHLLGIKQVAIVVNKMDRVDFSAERFKEISDEISAHLIALGVTPSAVIPISARDGDGVAEHTAGINWYQGPTVVEALDALEPARRSSNWCCGCRCRQSTSSMIAVSSPAASNPAA